ncbi:hypothetical protein [Sporisorium scitamineum]|uniref:Uncharacterized protein n=1 Tax=Sporisorium scitamineum TaxID=49012 RepID=A0A0F7S446_9BASI|nr:hypothetical protein [Sporisorium scitamineum]
MKTIGKIIELSQPQTYCKTKSSVPYIGRFENQVLTNLLASTSRATTTNTWHLWIKSLMATLDHQRN